MNENTVTIFARCSHCSVMRVNDGELDSWGRCSKCRASNVVNRRKLPVQRWDVYDIADELADVLAQLHTGLIPGYDPIEHLARLLERTWEASYLTQTAAAALREQRWQTFLKDDTIRDELGLPERSHDGMLV